MTHKLPIGMVEKRQTNTFITRSHYKRAPQLENYLTYEIPIKKKPTKENKEQKNRQYENIQT